MLAVEITVSGEHFSVPSVGDDIRDAVPKLLMLTRVASGCHWAKRLWGVFPRLSM